MSNARDLIYFTINCLQIDVTFKIGVGMSLKYNT